MKAGSRRLREGFSTGACAAAAAKAATIRITCPQMPVRRVSIPFPDGKNRELKIAWTKLLSTNAAKACVTKDAGDDPDVTDGAEIIAAVEITAAQEGPLVEIFGGKGVGRVTKPGLAVPPGKAAINPVPQKMIKEAVLSAVKDVSGLIKVTISVPEGEKLARKTLNRRLGIVGGISILGTTGIVKPISEAAWCATISVSMDVAIAMGIDTICLSTGRSSEEAAMKALELREEAFISMGDYVGFSLKEAASRPFKEIVLACQWSKLVKMAMGWDQTHVRFGPLEPKDGLRFIEKNFDHDFGNLQVNTVRQLFLRLKESEQGRQTIDAVCKHAYKRLREFLPRDKKLKLMLVSYDKEIANIQG